MSESEEAQMMRRVLDGRGNDRDFQNILERGSAEQKKMLYRMENDKIREKKHLERIYGDDAAIFDGKDKNGQLYKEVPLSDYFEPNNG